MVEAFLAFCNSKNIAIKGVKTLVAVSGGIDSVVLTHLLHEVNADLVIAHCNFNLRGEESDGDEQFAKKLAKELNVPFYSQNFETAAYAETKGISIQMAARELRYMWFEQLRVETACDQIATAHHKGDTVETVLFNLSKGTGLEGLHGIKPVNGKLVRPLLFATRSEIETYARESDIKWREDSSNESQKYSRNKIRISVVPVLEKINPQAQEAIASSAERVSEAEQFLDHQVEELKKQVLTKEGQNLFVQTDQLLNLPGHTYVLYTILKPFGFTYQQVDLIAGGLSAISGKLFYSNTHVVNLDRGQLIVSPIKTNQESISLSEKEEAYAFGSFTLQTKVYVSEAYKIKQDASILALDKDDLEFPIKVRVWQKGDTFIPLGMKGKKKLSDFMIDAKIPVNLKKNVWVVVSGETIAGVLNHRPDERFKVTEQTKEVFEITCQ